MSDPSTANRSIAVTGTGLLCPLGLSVDDAWAGVLDERSGLGPFRAMEQAEAADKPGGEVPFPARDDEDTAPRESKLLRSAMTAALSKAGIDGAPPYPSTRCGVLLGTTLHGMRAAGRCLRRDDPGQLRYFTASSILAEAAKGLSLSGFSATTCSACSSGLSSLLLGATLLRTGQLDLVVCGGYDPISEYAFAGFNSLRVISPDRPRPFSAQRTGMQVSEGYAALVLERPAEAVRRGATIEGLIAGGGESSDVHSLTQPSKDGAGAAEAMRQALVEADVSAEQLDLVVAHATATEDNDEAEHAALVSALGEALPRIPVVALKSRLGHMLGAAGAGELILALRAMRENLVPTTASAQDDTPSFEDLNLPIGRPERPERPLRIALSSALGFGGANTSVVIKAPDRDSPLSAITRRRMRTPPVITGIGVILPGVFGQSEFAALPASAFPLTGDIDEVDLNALLNARRVRRLSQYARLNLAAVSDAMRDADLSGPLDEPGDPPRHAAMLGTTYGSVSYALPYYRQIIDDGMAFANPMLFAEGVPNAAAAHVSMNHGIRGPCQTIIGSHTAGLDALYLATLRLRENRYDRVIVCAAEECHPLVAQAYERIGLIPKAEDFATAAGAVALVLEKAETARSRGARVLGRIAGGMGCRYDTEHTTQAVIAIAQILKSLNDPPSIWHLVPSGTSHDRVLKSAGRRARTETRMRSIAQCASASPLLQLCAALLDPEAEPTTPRIGVAAASPQGMATAITAICEDGAHVS